VSSECDHETSTARKPWLTGGLSSHEKKINSAFISVNTQLRY